MRTSLGRGRLGLVLLGLGGGLGRGALGLRGVLEGLGGILLDLVESALLSRSRLEGIDLVLEGIALGLLGGALLGGQRLLGFGGLLGGGTLGGDEGCGSLLLRLGALLELLGGGGLGLTLGLSLGLGLQQRHALLGNGGGLDLAQLGLGGKKRALLLLDGITVDCDGHFGCG